MNDNFDTYTAAEEKAKSGSAVQDTTEETVGKIKRDLHEIADSFNDFIESIEPKLTYNKYLEMLSDTIDEKILNMQAKENMIFYGGTLLLSVDKPGKFVDFGIEYYFKKTDGQWIRKREQGKTRISKFNVKDNDTIKFLQSDNVIKISIDPPEK